MNVVVLVLALAQHPQDTIELKPVVVTATRAAVPAALVPAATTVLRGADLEAHGVRTVAQALQLVPGAHIVETGSYGGQTSLFMRGGENDYVKVLVDGVPLNQPGGGLNLAHLTTDNVDRIEIVRGPASVLYGSDAVTGVVQIFTRAGTGAVRIGGDVRAGTYASTQFGADLEGGTSAAAYSVRVSRFGSDGLYPVNNEYRNSVVSGRLRLRPDARTEAALSYRYGDNLYHFPTNSQGQPADSNQRMAERGPLASLFLRRALGAIELTAQGTWREARQLSNDEPDSPGEDGTFWSNDYVRRAGAGLMLTWRPSPGATALSAGVDYEDERQRGRSEFSASFGTFPDSIDVQRWTTGYYAQAVVDVAPVAITAGARLDDNSQFETHGTYRVGVVFKPAGAARLHASIGTGFKEPTFFENFARGFVTGNPDLQPERSTSWEAGVERSLASGRLTLGATFFDQRFRDLIDFTGTSYLNVPGANSRGVELDADAILTPAFAMALRYTYLHTNVSAAGIDSSADALFVPGKPLLRRPAHSLVPELGMQLGGRTRLIAGARWVGKRDDRDFGQPPGSQRVTLDPYTHVNIAAQYTVSRFELTGKIENLFDDLSPEITGFRPRGRTILLGGRFSTGL
ncbi:MAG TPA: TonB-dependent receptor [Gemmatimonadales bacterium]|nr:TonB-dependent receptor [Gemmatimonadales bacterium]